MLKIHTKALNYSYSIGVYPTLELLQSRHKDVVKITIDDKGNKNAGLGKIIDVCKEERIEVVPNRILVNKLSKNENAYCVGVFKKYQCDLEKSQNHVVNLAIIKPACDIFDLKVIRSSMGALFKINFEYFDTFDDSRWFLEMRAQAYLWSLIMSAKA